MFQKLRKWKEKNLIYRVFFKKYRRYFFFGALSLIAVDIINIFPPLIIKKAIDVLSVEANLARIIMLSTLFFIVSLLQGICRYFWRIHFIGTSFKCDYDIRMAFFGHLETLSQRFFQKYKTGDLMSRATNDINAVRLAAGPGLLIGLDALFYFFVIPPIIIYLSPKLSFYTFLLMPLTPFIAYKIKDVIDRRFRKVQEQFSLISEKVRENISGIRIVKSYNMSCQEESIFRRLCTDFLKKNLKLAIPQALLGPIFEFITYMGIVLLLFIGGTMVIEGTITLGTVVAFQRYITMMLWPMTAIGWSLSLYQRGNASMKRIDEIMAERTEITTHNAVSKLFIPNGDIEFRDISFHYENQNEPVLKGINLKVSAGERIAIVGPIGSGKSTLVSMLPRIILVKNGILFLDGTDINTINIKSLRRHIGFVPQDTFLFSEKVADNILFGIEGREETGNAEEFACMVNIEKEIDALHQKYESYLGERGINMSGGQKQRLTIARALAIDPKIIILDDCLSAVDARVEDVIIRNIRKHYSGRTLIVVTHRLPAIRDFDKIVVLKEGMIIEEGTHAQLIRKNGMYTTLYTKEVFEEKLV